MDKKEVKKKAETGEKINQFIIECLFNKYFEEQEHREVVVEREKVEV